MRRSFLDYARPGSSHEQRSRPSLARLSLRLAIAVAVGQATLAALYLQSRYGAEHTIIEIAAIGIALVTPMLWVIALALTLAAWADRDGPRHFAATSLAILAGEAVVVFLAAGFLL